LLQINDCFVLTNRGTLLNIVVSLTSTVVAMGNCQRQALEQASVLAIRGRAKITYLHAHPNCSCSVLVENKNDSLQVIISTHLP